MDGEDDESGIHVPQTGSPKEEAGRLYRAKNWNRRQQRKLREVGLILWVMSRAKREKPPFCPSDFYFQLKQSA
jgi:hypothetical protein